MKIRNVFLLCALTLAGAARGQQELLLHQSDDLWASNALNPALFPEGKRLAIGLPAFGLDAIYSGKITYNDFIRRENGKTILDFSGLLDNLEPENDIYYAHRLETVSAGLRLPGGFSVQAGHAVRMHTVLHFPKTLPELLWNGNGPYVGQTLDIAPAAEMFDFNELYVGAAFELKSLRLGVRYKLFNGFNGLQSDAEHAYATVYTDPDIYQLSMHTDYGFYASSVINSIDTSGFGYDIKTELKDGKLFTKNRGSGFDLGLRWDITKRLHVQASVLDLGAKIKWKTDANYFLSQGDFTYDGVTFPGTDIINGVDSLTFENQLDSLNEIFQFVKTPAEFSTELPLRMYAGLGFKLSDRWQFGVSMFHQRLGDYRNTATGVSARWTPMRWVTLGALYVYNSRTHSDLGLQLVLKPGPVQLYVMTDNVLTAFSPYSSSAVNFKAGLGVVF